MAEITCWSSWKTERTKNIVVLVRLTIRANRPPQVFFEWMSSHWIKIWTDTEAGWLVIIRNGQNIVPKGVYISCSHSSVHLTTCQHQPSPGRAVCMQYEVIDRTEASQQEAPQHQQRHKWGLTMFTLPSRKGTRSFYAPFSTNHIISQFCIGRQYNAIWCIRLIQTHFWTCEISSSSPCHCICAILIHAVWRSCSKWPTLLITHVTKDRFWSQCLPQDCKICVRQDPPPTSMNTRPKPLTASNEKRSKVMDRHSLLRAKKER